MISRNLTHNLIAAMAGNVNRYPATIRNSLRIARDERQWLALNRDAVAVLSGEGGNTCGPLRGYRRA